MATLKADMEKLVDLFLTPDFSTIEHDDGETEEEEFVYEGEVEGVDVDTPPAATCHASTQHDAKFLMACGRKLAKMGDEFLHHKTGSMNDSSLRNNFENISKESDGWEKFKTHMDKCLAESDVKNGYMALGVVLLVAQGLSRLGLGVSQWVGTYVMRYIRDNRLDRDIERAGGLEGLMANEVD